MTPKDFPSGYEARRELGEGSMGSVWLAWSERFRGHCAVKILGARSDRRGSSERSFNREVRAMARLDHPGIIAVHDFGRTPGGSPFVAMEYVPGRPLNDYVRGEWSWPRLWALIDGLLTSLAHAHARDLVHRDVKPGNILLVPDVVGAGAVKLVDFGIALAVEEAGRASRRIEGTPAYIAPEAAAGDVAAIGPWTDLYSLGVILFEILSGDQPFHGRQLLAHHQRRPLPELKIRPQVSAPAELLPIVLRLLEKSPLRRFRSVAHVRGSFLAKLGELPTPAAFEDPERSDGSELSFSWDDSIELTGEDLELITPLQGPSGLGLVHLREPPLLGREPIQAVLTSATEDVLRGDGPRVVVIEGAAGLGKSRLGAWLRQQVEEQGRMRTLVVRSEPQATGGGLRQAVLRFIGAPTARPHEADQVLAEAFPDEESRQNARTILFGPLLDGSEQTIHQVARMIRDLAGRLPFLLWADDAQWSPEGRMLHLIHRLAQADNRQRMLLLVTLRPSQRKTVQAAHRSLVARRNVQHLQLGTLSPDRLAESLDALAPLPEGLAEGAAMLAAGIPLIALEAVRHHVESEGMGSAPSDPNAVLDGRIERLRAGPNGPALRSALARATLLGRSFALAPLSRLCAVQGDVDAPTLADSTVQTEALLERAVNSGLIIDQGPGRWRFSHDLIRGRFREIAQGLSNWAALNQVAAELKAPRVVQDSTGIELEVVARHWWEGGERGQALHLGLESVGRLLGAGLMGHATSFVRRLLDWDDQAHLLSAEERGELRLIGCDAAEHAGQPYEAERHATAVVGIAERNYLPALGARAACRIGSIKLRSGELTEGERWLWDALQFARRSRDSKALADVQLSLGEFYQHNSRLELALTAYEESREHALEGGLTAEALAAQSAIGNIDRLEGRLDRAERMFEQVITQAQAANLEVVALRARLQLGLCAWASDDPATARRVFDEVREGAARGNLFWLEFYAALGSGWAAAAADEWTEAEGLIMQAEDLRYDIRLRDAEVESVRLALRALAHAGRRPDLVARIDRLSPAAGGHRSHPSTQAPSPSVG